MRRPPIPRHSILEALAAFAIALALMAGPWIIIAEVAW